MSQSSEWTQVSDGLCQRPMGENERFLRFIGDRSHAIGREHWSVTATAIFQLKAPNVGENNIDFKKALREAWKLLRFRHPSIASSATSDSNLQYVVPRTAENLEDWLAQSYFVVQEPDVDADVLVSRLQPKPMATLHYLASQSQIVLHTAHWRTDAYGAFHLIEALFAGLAHILDTGAFDKELAWGDEVGRLVPSVEFALRLPDHASSDIVDAARQYLATGRHLHGTVGLQCRSNGTTKPEGTRHAHLSIPEEITAKLEATCQDVGIDLYSATHAAVAKLNHTRTAAEDQHKHYTSTIRLNLRPHLHAPYNTPLTASGVYTGGYMFRIEPNQSLVEIARQLQAQYSGEPSDEFILSRRQYAKMVLDVVKSGAGPPPPTSNMDVSFIRGVDNIVRSQWDTKYGTLIIENLGLGVETLSMQAYCVYWKFNGRLTLSIWFNDAHYDISDMAKLLEELRDILVAEFS
ncbi:putative Major facilitator superfamily (MFS) profile domain-containing protein [Seiridium cardinale]|uniref:Major facilitator superfamily (MFS) profile domain-containing protein n=1 Tax=Seiridium cardinale TaxID=138064 RepID=A0ABR2XGT2_9PEZI